jgi:predicted O-methyltransferase YrrM
MTTFDEAWDSYRTDVSKSAALLQQKEELRGAWEAVKAANCKSFLEIGTRNGGSLYVLAQALPPGSLIAALDRVERKSDEILTRQVLEALGTKGYNTGYIIADSTHAEAIDAADEYGPYDLVHIDGDHSWDGARNDWDHYGKKAKKICLFHDIIWVGPGTPPPNVVDFWRRIAATDRPTEEYRDEGSKMGIGLVRMK